MSSLVLNRTEVPAGRRGVQPAATRKHLRVLVVGHTYALRINQQKLDALARRCASVGLLVPSNWRNRDGLYPDRRLTPERGYDSFTVFQARVLRPGHVASFLFEPAALARALARFKADLVHVDQEVYSLASAQVAAAAKAAGSKVVVFGWENLDREIHPLQRAARRLVLSLADALVCGSREAARLLKKWGYRRRIDVIPQLGVDPSYFRPVAHRTPGPFRIGFVGRLVREKGVDLLLAALGALAGKGLKFEAAVCGAGGMETELRLLARSLQIEDRVRWLGAAPHELIPDVMGRFDTLVLPSRQCRRWKEQFGHVLIEAMAMGIPVVGSSSGAIPEVIGREDLVFEEENAGALARILERLLTDEDWRREAGRHGLERVRQHYTHDRIAEKLTGLWADTVEAEPC